MEILLVLQIQVILEQELVILGRFHLPTQQHQQMRILQILHGLLQAHILLHKQLFMVVVMMYQHMTLLYFHNQHQH